MKRCVVLIGMIAAGVAALAGSEVDLSQRANTWVKRSPLPGTPPSPRLGYEGACVWDGPHGVLIRYGGHNQGGGGEQHSELWTFDPRTAQWQLKEPNTSPPGVCCAQQNVFDPVRARYLRFPAFSGNHGWQWWRELYLNDSSVWSYDLGANQWENQRPLPTPHPHALRCASWDSDNEVVVLFGGEGNNEGTLVYDPYENSWVRMKPPHQPEPRSGGNIVYDAAHRLHILFGSQFGNDPHTWAYDLPRNEWRDLLPTTMPPTDQNDAVMTYDPINRRIIAIVKITEGGEEAARHRLETWSYDADANTWKKLGVANEPDASGNRARNLVFASQLNLAILENRTHGEASNEQQIWTYRFAETETQRHKTPPPDVRVAVGVDQATLSWTTNATAGRGEFAVYRGEGGRPWEIDFRRVGIVRDPSFEDAPLKRGANYFYMVRAVGAGGREGPPSALVRTQPRIVEELAASVLSGTRIELTWKPAADATGYLIERAPVEVLSEDQLKRLKARTTPLPEPSVGAIKRIGQFVRLTESPLREAHFTDATIDLTKPVTIEGEPIDERTFSAEHFDPGGKAYRFAVFAYRIRAVNALHAESGPSGACFTIPAAPQFFFCKEEGETAQLTWVAPRGGAKSYRVYRMDGRYDKEPLPRLTAEPIAALSFTDAQAGKAARRYHVVAVDTLGQEGFPSAPAWFQREWRKYYEPFVGDWHQ